MSRSALILSCAIHGSVLAVVGWSSLLIAPRLDHDKAEVSVSLSPGESALVTEDLPAPLPTPEIAMGPAETNFTPPAPILEPMPVTVPPVEITPPSLHTVAEVPQKMSVAASAKRERSPHTATGSARRGSSSGAAPGLNAGGSGGGSDYVPPQFLLRYKPPYPESARAQRLEGLVMLIVDVDAEGRVTSASLRQGCGHMVLDRAALEAVRSWRFAPARKSGHAISSTVEIPIRFNFAG